MYLSGFCLFGKTVQIDEDKTYKADHYTDDLVPGDRFLENNGACDDKKYRKYGALYYGDRADLPSGFVCAYGAEFQTDYRDPEDKACPVHFAVFGYDTSAFAEQHEKDKGCDRSYKIGYRQ